MHVNGYLATFEGVGAGGAGAGGVGAGDGAGVDAPHVLSAVVEPVVQGDPSAQAVASEYVQAAHSPLLVAANVPAPQAVQTESSSVVLVPVRRLASQLETV